jgi:hypothetical protein
LVNLVYLIAFIDIVDYPSGAIIDPSAGYLRHLISNIVLKRAALYPIHTNVAVLNSELNVKVVVISKFRIWVVW